MTILFIIFIIEVVWYTVITALIVSNTIYWDIRCYSFL